MSGGYVAITDNADPMDVVVFRKDSGGLVCTQPVFRKGASDTDHSLIAAGNAIVVENNYGYTGPAATEEGRTTTAGLERVDVNADGSGCRKVWHSDEIAPTVVPKLSLANGLVYTYTHPAGDGSDPWYFTALDFRDRPDRLQVPRRIGARVQQQLRAVTIGPDGTAYVGVLGGLVAVRDATPPPIPGAGTGPGAGGRPTTLRVRFTRRRLPGGRPAPRPHRARHLARPERRVRRERAAAARRHERPVPANGARARAPRPAPARARAAARRPAPGPPAHAAQPRPALSGSSVRPRPLLRLARRAYAAEG